MTTDGDDPDRSLDILDEIVEAIVADRDRLADAIARADRQLESARQIALLDAAARLRRDGLHSLASAVDLASNRIAEARAILDEATPADPGATDG